VPKVGAAWVSSGMNRSSDASSCFIAEA